MKAIEKALDLADILGYRDSDWEKIEPIIKAARAELERMRWVPVDERMPELKRGWSDAVLVVLDWEKNGGNRTVQIAQAALFTGGTVRFAGVDHEHVTHWRELPEPPEEA